MSLVTDLLHRVVVILLALVTVLLGWLIAFPDELASAPPTHAEFTYTCDSQHNAAVATTTTERGPPATYDRATTYDAVGLWSRGTSACSDVPTLRTPTTYDDPTRFVQVAQATGTTPEPVRHLDGALSAFARSGVAANAASGAESALSGSLLRTHLRQLEKYGQGGFRELESGRFRYYGNLSPAAKEGEMAGRRLVREWDPATGYTRTWHETIDQAGNIRIVRPETGGPKTHYYFDEFGNYGGAW